jgi:hypothetical protein
MFIHDGVLYKDSVKKIGDNTSNEFINRVTGGYDTFEDGVIITPRKAEDLKKKTEIIADMASVEDNTEELFNAYGV